MAEVHIHEGETGSALRRFKRQLTVPFIRTGARESSSWPGVRSTSRPNTFLQTTSANLEFLLDTKRRTIHFYRGDKIRPGATSDMSSITGFLTDLRSMAKNNA